MYEVVVLNGSPSKLNRNTGKVLIPFMEGLKKGGANITLFNSCELDIKPCNCGRMTCWGKTPGQCIHHDDMDEILQAIKQAEILIFATPVYIPLPGAFQEVLNRLCPLLDPILTFREGRTRAKLRDDVKVKKYVLVGVSGWWELENLDTVVRIVKELAEDSNVDFGGAILRPHAHALAITGSDVLDDIQQAGFDLITKGFMDAEMLKRISRPLIDRKADGDYV